MQRLRKEEKRSRCTSMPWRKLLLMEKRKSLVISQGELSHNSFFNRTGSIMFKQVLKVWLPLAATVTLVCFIIYGTVQQSYRSNANDPQYQMAEDAMNSLGKGIDPKQLISEKQIEIS